MRLKADDRTSPASTGYHADIFPGGFIILFLLSCIDRCDATTWTPAFQRNMLTPVLLGLLSHPKVLRAHMHPNRIPFTTVSEIYRTVREVSEAHHPGITSFYGASQRYWVSKKQEARENEEPGCPGKLERVLGKREASKVCKSLRVRRTGLLYTWSSPWRGGTAFSNIPRTRCMVDAQKRMQEGCGWFRRGESTSSERMALPERDGRLCCDRLWVMTRLSTSRIWVDILIFW